MDVKHCAAKATGALFCIYYICYFRRRIFHTQNILHKKSMLNNRLLFYVCWFLHKMLDLLRSGSAARQEELAGSGRSGGSSCHPIKCRNNQHLTLGSFIPLNNCRNIIYRNIGLFKVVKIKKLTRSLDEHVKNIFLSMRKFMSFKNFYDVVQILIIFNYLVSYFLIYLN